MLEMAQETEPVLENPRKGFNACRLLAVIALVLIFAAALTKGSLNIHEPTLKVGVTANGSYVNVTNNDSFLWTDVRMVLNTDFKYNTQSIEPGTTISVAYSQYVKDDGTKFSPYSQAIDLYINAIIENDQHSYLFYYFP